MSIYTFNGHTPIIGNGSFIAPSVDIIGDVILGENCSIWFGSVLRGDVGKINVGSHSNIQDLSMLHNTKGIDLTIGKNVTIGHRVTLHSCTIEDSCLIGINSVLLDNVYIGANSLVAAGTIIPPGKEFPPGSFIMGPVAKKIRDLNDEEKCLYANHYKHYIDTKNEYLNQWPT